MAKISALPAVTNPRGDETVVVVKDGETRRIGVTPLVEAAVAPSVDRAGSEADRSEAGALAALVALGDGVYDTIADGLAATPEGDGFYAIDAAGGLSLSRKEGGKAEEVVSFPTRTTMRALEAYTSLAALRAAPRTTDGYTLVTADGRVDYAFVQGDFTAVVDDSDEDDAAVVALTAVPVSEGALVRQKASALSYGRSNLALPLDRSIPRTLAYMSRVDPFTTLSQQSKLERAFADAAAEGYKLTGHADAAYRHDGVLPIGGSFDGQGGTFIALSDGFNCLRLSGTAVDIRNFTTLGAAQERANGDDRHDGLYCVDLYDFSLSNVQVGSVDDDGARGFAAAGALFRHCQRGRIDNLRVAHTRADGIHVTANSKDLDFIAPYVFRSGDDGFAVVDYLADDGFVENIKTFGGTIREARARGMSVVGGRNIRYTNPSVYLSSAAAFLFSQESGDFVTKPVYDARVVDGFASHCVTGIGLAADFSNAVFQATGQVADSSMSGRIENAGRRANAGVSFADPQVARFTFDAKIADLFGTDFAPIAINAGGRDCEGVAVIQGCGGLALVMPVGGQAIGKHHYRFVASSGIRTQGGPIDAIAYLEALPNMQRLILEGSWDNGPGTLLIDVGDNGARVERRDIWINGVRLP